MRALAESVVLASLVPEASVNLDQEPAVFHPMEVNLDQDTEANLDQVAAVDHLGQSDE